jgi:hypothetical protein
MKEILVILTGISIGILLAKTWQVLQGGNEVFGKSVVRLGSGIQAAVVILTIIISFALSHATQYTFNQYYNGVETGVEMIPRRCSIDSGCYYTYTRSVVTYTTDSKGHRTSHTTYYHDPLFTEEDEWIIHTTVGDIFLSTHRLPARWLPGIAYTQYGEVSYRTLLADVADAGVGMPAEAEAAQQALDRGDPRPATVLSPYENFIEGNGASSGLTATSDKIEYYQHKGVLPSIASTVYGGDQANKVDVEKVALARTSIWQEALARLNMEAGSIQPVSNRFDIQLIVVNSAVVPALESRVYTQAVNAYWESPIFRKSALPKNMCVAVIGTDGQTVTWAYGFTLIDTKDNILWNEMAAFLPGKSMNPYTLIGWPHAVVQNGHFQKVVRSNGALEQMVLFNPHHFVRAPMTNNQGHAGYNYLDTGPDLGFCFWMLVVSWGIGAILINATYWIIKKA